MKLKGARVLVTGVTGFKGGWLARTLVDSGARVYGFGRGKGPGSLALHGLAGKVRLLRGDVRSLDTVSAAVKKCRPHALVHLAAETRSRAHSVEETLETNFLGTLNVLEAARLHGVKNVVVASTGKVYGPGKKTVSEREPLKAKSLYGWSKAAADQVALAYSEDIALNVVVVRSGNVFGPCDISRDRLMPNAARAILSGRPPIINGSGNARRDFVFVGDVAEAYKRILQRVERKNVSGQAFNVVSGKQRSINDVVKALARALGKNVKPLHKKRAAKEEQEGKFSIRKAGRLLGWRPRHSFSSALKETASWYRDNASTLRQGKG